MNNITQHNVFGNNYGSVEKMSNADILDSLLNHIGMTQNKLAEVIGCSQANISNVRHGKYTISEELANRIVTAFPDVNLDFLLNGNGVVSNNAPKGIRKQRTYTTVDTLADKVAILEEKVRRLEAIIQSYEDR